MVWAPVKRRRRANEGTVEVPWVAARGKGPTVSQPQPLPSREGYTGWSYKLESSNPHPVLRSAASHLKARECHRLPSNGLGAVEPRAVSAVRSKPALHYTLREDMKNVEKKYTIGQYMAVMA